MINTMTTSAAPSDSTQRVDDGVDDGRHVVCCAVWCVHAALNWHVSNSGARESIAHVLHMSNVCARRMLGEHEFRHPLLRLHHPFHPTDTLIVSLIHQSFR